MNYCFNWTRIRRESSWGVLEKVELSENITLDAEVFLKEMLKHLPPAKASSIAAKVLSGRRQDYYEMALSLL